MDHPGHLSIASALQIRGNQWLEEKTSLKNFGGTTNMPVIALHFYSRRFLREMSLDYKFWEMHAYF